MYQTELPGNLVYYSGLLYHSYINPENLEKTDSRSYVLYRTDAVDLL